MNNADNYKIILDKHFGAGTATFSTTSGHTNNLIAALNDPQYWPFRSAFEKRLERLAARYPSGHPDRSELTVRANDIATSNWDGAYAELIAFDFLNSDQHYLTSPISLSKTVPATQTLAGALGMQNVNLDGYYDDFAVWFDIKVLADKSRDILNGMTAQVKGKLGITDATVSPEYPLHLDYMLFQQSRKALVTEFESALIGGKKPTYIRSSVIPELAYRILWGSGVVTAVSIYNPYAHAEKHHPLLFSHAKKFSHTSPTLIVFVVFPWFSERVVVQTNSSETFYRAFSRRFFCQYAKDTRPAGTLLKPFAGPESLAQVTDKLSGVVFLEDSCITTSKPDEQNIRGFAYLNPNAVHKVGGLFRNYLSGLGLIVDDLEHDNY